MKKQHTQNVLALLLSLGLIAVVGYATVTTTRVEQDIKVGVANLYCHIGKEPRKWIDPTKIKYLSDDGTWVFTNGSSKQCEVVYVDAEATTGTGESVQPQSTDT